MNTENNRSNLTTEAQAVSSRTKKTKSTKKANIVGIEVQHPNIKLMGYRVARARDKRGLSQEDLAGLIECDRTEISKMENGKHFLFKKIVELSDALGVTADYILTGKERRVRYRIKRK